MGCSAKVLPVVIVVSCCSLFLGFAEASPADPETGLSRQDLTSEFKSENLDRIVTALNRVKAMRYPQDVLPLVQDVWDGRKEKYPDLPWDVLSSNVVRIELADVLIQADTNGRIKTNRPQIHSFARGLIRDADRSVAIKAMLLLGWVDDPTDVGELAAIAKANDPHTMRVAVLSLEYMCNPAAETALGTLRRKADPEVRAAITEVIASSREVKTARCRH